MATRQTTSLRCARVRNLVVSAATLGVPASTLQADGNFDGEQVSVPQIRQWVVPGPNPGLNWGGDTLPVAADPLSFGLNGDGGLNLGGATVTHPSMTFTNWTSYQLYNGIIDSLPLISVGEGIDGTYGSAYFPDGTSLVTGLAVNVPLSINFTGTGSGALRLDGLLAGAADLTLSSVPTFGTRGVYFSMTNPGYSGATNVGFSTAARLVGSGRTGTGVINLNGGGIDILSDALLGEVIPNPINSAVGTIRADHNYNIPIPVVPFAPGITHTLGPIIVDNPAAVGGVFDAYVTFGADNGYNFATPTMILANAALAPGGPFRVVTVDNGQRYAGFAGSTRVTGPNRLGELVVTTTIGPAGFPGPTLFDFDPATGTGMTLSKVGTGVLEINGDNEVSSTGLKNIFGGVIRFNTPLSYGTVPGIPGGVPVPVTLAGGPGPVSAGMGVGYPTPPPPNMVTTGFVPGQSGAFDVDFLGNFAPVPLTTVNIGGALTAWRLGSSGTGSQFGPVVSWTDAFGDNYYYLGGGGGELDMGVVLPAGPGPGATWVEMGTTGDLLPGRVNLMAPVGPFFAGGTLIRAGTLGVVPPPTLAATPGTSLGAYSTGIDTGSNYVGAPAVTPYNGPGQLLLDAAIHTGGGYFYGPGGAFGAAGLMLDGGAIGWSGGVPLFAVPGVYGAPLASTLYSSTTVPAPAVATNILHLGGEDSAGPMVVFFPITDNFIGGTPVALLKSGSESLLDLTAVPVHPYTGGTGIMGGTITVNAPGQLGTGAITIADGGALTILPGPIPAPLFDQVLRVANGPMRRSSLVQVEPGVVATFTGLTSPTGLALEANAVGSILEKVGPGRLNIYSAFLAPAAVATVANTWGIKASEGMISINHLPGASTPANGQALFLGGMLELVAAPDPGAIPIPPAIQYDPEYGFGGLTTYAATSSVLNIQDGAFFRITGGQRSEWMGRLVVTMGATSVFKLAGNPTGDDTRGTGIMVFSGGNVQMTPGAGNNLIPADGAFTLELNNSVRFSGAGGPTGQLNGNLLFNSDAGSALAQIDGAVITNAPAPVASTWTIAGTGLTSWNNLVVKTRTEAVPGAGGPFTNGTVTINRMRGAPVIVQPGSVFRIDYGVVNAGGTGDPFQDNSGLATTGNRVNVENNVSGPGIGSPAVLGFNIRQEIKNVGTLSITGFNPAAPALGTSATAVFPSATLVADHIRQSRLDINGGAVARIRVNGGNAGTSRVNTLNIAGVAGAWTGQLDLADNDLIYDYTGASPQPTVLDQIRQGFAGGAHTGLGINTSSGVGTVRGLGYGEAAALGLAAFDGQAVDATTLLVKYTYFGDANLDGQVDITDLARLATAWQTAGVWIDGDFDYSGFVDISDLARLATNWQAGVGAPLAMGFDRALAAVGLSGVSVPEPTTCLGGLLVAGALRRRRQRLA